MLETMNDRFSGNHRPISERAKLLGTNKIEVRETSVHYRFRHEDQARDLIARYFKLRR